MDTALIRKLKKYLKTQPIEKAWIFGSFSRNEEKEDSDLDLIVQFSKGTNLGFRYFSILDELERLCRRKVDMAEYDMLDPAIISNVDTEKILIYERSH